MTRVYRWPLHPKPQPDESLSSWVFRLAQVYDMSWEAFFCDAIGTDPIDDHVLDRQPPEPLVQTLAMRTGVQPERLWAMTLSSYVPWIIDTLDPDDANCLTTYATQYQTLLTRQTPWMSKGLYNRKTGRYDLPWLGETKTREQALCLACLRSDRIPYLRLFWRLCLMGSCPIHGCMLTPVSWPALSIFHHLETPLVSAAPDLLSVDGFSLQAVTTGTVNLRGDFTMNAAVYLRFLRSLVEELFCRRSAAGSQANTIATIWKEVGCRPYAGLMMSKPFERLTLEQRCGTLRAVGRLLSNLPDSLQRYLPLPLWGRRQPRHLPDALHQMCPPFQAAHPETLPGMRLKPLSLSQIVPAIQELVQSDEGAEQLIRFITAYSSRQTPEELWQLVREIRIEAAASSTSP